MRAEDLLLTYLYVEIDYPQLRRFTGDEFPDFWHRIHRTHPFEAADANEGLFETESERRFAVDRTEMALQEWVRVGFEPLKKNAVDLFSEAIDHFGVTFFRVANVTLRAQWPVPEESQPISEALRDKLLQLADDNYKFLGDVEGTPVEFVGDAEDPDRHWHVRIDASRKEDSPLYIETVNYFFVPLQKAEVLGEYLQVSYDFLTHNVTHFVNSFME